MAVDNDPKTLAKLLRAIARSGRGKENQHDVIFEAAADTLDVEISALRAALNEINLMPFSMVNDSEGLRHTIRTIQRIAERALNGR